MFFKSVNGKSQINKEFIPKLNDISRLKEGNFQYMRFMMGPKTNYRKKKRYFRIVVLAFGVIPLLLFSLVVAQSIGSNWNYRVEHSRKTPIKFAGKTYDISKTSNSRIIVDKVVVAKESKPTSNPEVFYDATLKSQVTTKDGESFTIKLVYAGYSNDTGVKQFSAKGFVKHTDGRSKEHKFFDSFCSFLPWDEHRRSGILEFHTGEKLEASIEAKPDKLKFPRFIIRWID